jgi:hypothetical protein
MTATYSTFIAAIAGMTVSGVTRKYTEPPASISTADLPCSFPMLPSGADTVLTFGNAGVVGGQQSSFTCDLVFAYEAMGQGTQNQNFGGLVTLMDAVVTASRALTRPTQGPMTYSLRVAPVSVAGNDYWAIVETWTGVG